MRTTGQLVRGFPKRGNSNKKFFAAHGILAMLADTMIPEVFGVAHNYAGLITVLGFLCAFLLTQ